VALLAACGHTKETVVERPGPAVIERQTVIEHQAPAAGGTAVSRACTFNSATYSDGGLSCQAGHQYMCNNGTWQLTTSGC
jgi:hypothetical protein